MNRRGPPGPRCRRKESSFRFPLSDFQPFETGSARCHSGSDPARTLQPCARANGSPDLGRPGWFSLATLLSFRSKIGGSLFAVTVIASGHISRAKAAAQDLPF